MSDRIWSDINNKKMKNKNLPMFPYTETVGMIDGNGKPITSQKTIGGNTKFENAVITIAQGLAQSGVVGEDDIARIAMKVTTDIFDLLEKESA